MGLLTEVVGAVVGVEAEKKLNPEGGLLAEGIAAVTGFKGAEAVTNLLNKKPDEEAAENSADSNDAQNA